MGQELQDHFRSWTNDKFWEACVAIHLLGELQATKFSNYKLRISVVGKTLHSDP